MSRELATRYRGERESAQEQLRHSDARITLGIYGRVIGEARRDAVNKVGEILRPNARLR